MAIAEPNILEWFPVGGLIAIVVIILYMLIKQKPEE